MADSDIQELKADVKELRNDLQEFELRMTNWVAAEEQAVKTRQSYVNVFTWAFATLISLGSLLIQWLDAH